MAQFGLDFGGFGPPFWRFLGSILEVSGHDLGPMWLVILVLVKLFFFTASTGTGWAGGVTRSAKNCNTRNIYNGHPRANWSPRAKGSPILKAQGTWSSK